jgi:hypothetical protein
MKANESQIGGTHYKTQYEHWDLAVAIPLGYLEGCATKYVCRWRKKGGIQDLIKAMHYLEKLIEVTSYPIHRNLSLSEIDVEVFRFVDVNNLNVLEGEFIHTLCTYREPVDLLVALDCLREIIGNVQAEMLQFKKELEELNRPGTPEDGGHHERTSI